MNPSSHGADAERRNESWPTPGRTILACDGVVRDLGGAVKNRVLHATHLEIREREFVSLTGKSGSGKSTLLYLLGALDRPTLGRVVLDGSDIGSMDDDERAALRSSKLGFVFQFHFLLPEFSALENVMLPMLKRAAHDPATIRRRALEALERVGLQDLAARLPVQLSGGQQQRVSIARATANDPRIILADEPTGNLDTSNGLLVMDYFEQLVRDQDLTIVMVTHEASFARRTSRQLSMRDGRIIEDVDQRSMPNRLARPAD